MDETKVSTPIFIKHKLIARELDKFFLARNGEGFNNLDLMADSLENLNIIVSNDIKKIGKQVITQRIRTILEWYRTIEKNPKSYTRTPDGDVFNENVYYKASKILTKYFTILKDEVEELGLMD